jgi:hypothetical protein
MCADTDMAKDIADNITACKVHAFIAAKATNVSKLSQVPFIPGKLEALRARGHGSD